MCKVDLTLFACGVNELHGMHRLAHKHDAMYTYCYMYRMRKMKISPYPYM